MEAQLSAALEELRNSTAEEFEKLPPAVKSRYCINEAYSDTIKCKIATEARPQML